MITVVIVEDEYRTREGVGKLIEKLDLGFSVAGMAENGYDGLKLIQAAEPDLVITDIQMPKMDGLQLLEQIRLDGRKTKVIILSAYSDFGYARSALSNGAFDYLLKPIKKADFADMLHRMYEHIEAKSGQAAYYQVLDGYARGLVGKEEIENVVSSTPINEVGQRPGMVNQDTDQSATKIVRDALLYIKKHYNENISLTDVAEHVNVNKSYLCDVFKKEQNTNKTSEKFAASVNCCYFCRRITNFVIRTPGHLGSNVSLKGFRTSFLEYLITRFPESDITNLGY